jgi:hypothetical protein
MIFARTVPAGQGAKKPAAAGFVTGAGGLLAGLVSQKVYTCFGICRNIPNVNFCLL